MEQGEEESGQGDRKISWRCNTPGHIEARSTGNVRSDYEYGNISLLYGIAEKTVIPVGTHHILRYSEKHTAIAHEIRALPVWEDLPVEDKNIQDGEVEIISEIPKKAKKLVSDMKIDLDLLRKKNWDKL